MEGNIIERALWYHSCTFCLHQTRPDQTCAASPRCPPCWACSPARPCSPLSWPALWPRSPCSFKVGWSKIRTVISQWVTDSSGCGGAVWCCWLPPWRGLLGTETVSAASWDAHLVLSRLNKLIFTFCFENSVEFLYVECDKLLVCDGTIAYWWHWNQYTAVRWFEKVCMGNCWLRYFPNLMRSHSRLFKGIKGDLRLKLFVDWLTEVWTTERRCI